MQTKCKKRVKKKTKFLNFFYNRDQMGLSGKSSGHSIYTTFFTQATNRKLSFYFLIYQKKNVNFALQNFLFQIPLKNNVNSHNSQYLTQIPRIKFYFHSIFIHSKTLECFANIFFSQILRIFIQNRNIAIDIWNILIMNKINIKTKRILLPIPNLTNILDLLFCFWFYTL